jgi:hypothetical protein
MSRGTTRAVVDAEPPRQLSVTCSLLLVNRVQEVARSFYGGEGSRQLKGLCDRSLFRVLYYGTRWTWQGVGVASIAYIKTRQQCMQSLFARQLSTLHHCHLHPSSLPRTGFQDQEIGEADIYGWHRPRTRYMYLTTAARALPGHVFTVDEHGVHVLVEGAAAMRLEYLGTAGGTGVVAFQHQPVVLPLVRASVVFLASAQARSSAPIGRSAIVPLGRTHLSTNVHVYTKFIPVSNVYDARLPVYQSVEQWCSCHVGVR